MWPPALRRHQRRVHAGRRIARPHRPRARGAGSADAARRPRRQQSRHLGKDFQHQRIRQRRRHRDLRAPPAQEARRQRCSHRHAARARLPAGSIGRHIAMTAAVNTSVRTPSLRRQLSFWLLLPLLGLLALDAWLTYTRAMTAANSAFDRTLEASLKAMRDGVRLRDGHFAIDLPYLALDILESETGSSIFYRLVDANGKTLTG